MGLNTCAIITEDNDITEKTKAEKPKKSVDIEAKLKRIERKVLRKEYGPVQDPAINEFRGTNKELKKLYKDANIVGYGLNVSHGIKYPKLSHYDSSKLITDETKKKYYYGEKKQQFGDNKKTN
ncbi:hypothetical protein Trydic_g21001 [Trypoxylus dichotomus]